MTSPDKLTIKQIESYIDEHERDFPHYLDIPIAEQLLNTMRDNERLRELLKQGIEKYSFANASYADNWYAEAEEYFHYRSKDSDHG